MPKAKILYQADQEISGKHLIAKEWIEYSGKLTVYNKQINPSVTHQINPTMKSTISRSLIIFALVLSAGIVYGQNNPGLR